MTDLTEKNLENVLLNLTKTDKPITIKPTTWFGNPAKTAQWYKCPHCAKQSPLTLEWVGLTDREMMDAISLDDTPMEMGRKIEQALKELNT
jgi:hypothetical protein